MQEVAQRVSGLEAHAVRALLLRQRVGSAGHPLERVQPAGRHEARRQGHARDGGPDARQARRVGPAGGQLLGLGRRQGVRRVHGAGQIAGQGRGLLPDHFGRAVRLAHGGGPQVREALPHVLAAHAVAPGHEEGQRRPQELGRRRADRAPGRRHLLHEGKRRRHEGHGSRSFPRRKTVFRLPEEDPATAHGPHQVRDDGPRQGDADQGHVHDYLRRPFERHDRRDASNENVPDLLV